MAATRSSTEPSMEEILASIRRIIAEDGPNPPDGRGASISSAPAMTKGNEKNNVLDLTEIVEDNDQSQPASLASTPEPQVPTNPAPLEPIVPSPTKLPPEKTEVEPAPGAILRKSQPAPPARAAAAPDALVSARAQAQAQQALTELRRAAEVERAKASETGRDTTGLEALVLEALKPQLKAWLDQNLGPLVERVVREEVRRLVKQQTQA